MGDFFSMGDTDQSAGGAFTSSSASDAAGAAPTMTPPFTGLPAPAPHFGGFPPPTPGLEGHLQLPPAYALPPHVMGYGQYPYPWPPQAGWAARGPVCKRRWSRRPWAPRPCASQQHCTAAAKCRCILHTLPNSKRAQHCDLLQRRPWRRRVQRGRRR